MADISFGYGLLSPWCRAADLREVKALHLVIDQRMPHLDQTASSPLARSDRPASSGDHCHPVIGRRIKRRSEQGAFGTPA
jgi:hypothetical protein